MTVQSYQPRIDLSAYETAPKHKWRLGMLLALALLGAFALVWMYDGWFRDIVPGATNQARVSTSDTTAEKPGHVSPATSRRTSSKHRADALVPPPASEAPLTFAAGIIQSAIRSPLAVEVISGGGKHQVVGTRDDTIYLGLHDETFATPDVIDASAGSGKGEIKESEQIRLSSGVGGLVSPPMEAVDHSRLAKQQIMEGSVVLLARIDKDGNIEDIQEISGPEVLFSAAREAVKQWHFQPYYTSGQAVKTQTQITVKFAISAH
jgi:TonB family protein